MMLFRGILIFCVWNSWCISRGHLTIEVSNVHFSSLNFQTFLHWDVLTGAEAVYYVQYKIYGEDWENITDCWRILMNWCNMTSEMSKPEHKFEPNYARVKAITTNYSSPWKETGPFNPFDDTNIGPPIVSLMTPLNGISLNITIPKAIRQSKYIIEKRMKTLFFIITVTSLSEMNKVYETTENTYNISNLTPGTRYCITVHMDFRDNKKTSFPSSEECVTLEGTIAKQIIIGSTVAAIAVLVLVSIWGIYLQLDKYVFNPKPHLPSNLILNGLKSKESVPREDECLSVSSTLENMELTKYVLEGKANSKENPLYKRYISTEPRRKDYINCRPCKIDHTHHEIVIEMKNLTYDKSVIESSSAVEYPNVCISSHSQHGTSLTKTLEILLYSNDPKEPSYINDHVAFGQHCMNITEKYVTQDKVLPCSYINFDNSFQKCFTVESS